LTIFSRCFKINILKLILSIYLQNSFTWLFCSLKTGQYNNCKYCNSIMQIFQSTHNYIIYNDGYLEKKSQKKKPWNNILGKKACHREKNPLKIMNLVGTIYFLLVLSYNIRKQCNGLHFTYTRFINILFL